MTILWRKVPIKYIITLLVVVLFFIAPAQAADVCPDDMTAQVTNLLNILLSFLSRLRIPLATFAWKLMGNGFVYGEFMNLDKVLYYLWNLSRTFANFLIVGLLLYKIIWDSLGWKLDQSEVVKYIVKMVGWVILINASWFIIGAMVDISTILTSSVASLPSTYIASDGGNIRDTIALSMGKNINQTKQTINLSTPLCSTQPITTVTSKTNNWEPVKVETTEELLDKILPNDNSISWPLLYLGVSVLRIQDYLRNSNNPNSYIDNLFVIGVRLTITITFTFSLILLIVVNIFRLVTIWFAVAFGPILIILILNKQTDLLWDIWKKFSIDSIARAIFSPVLAVGMMSLWLIVVIIMQWFLQLKTNIERGDAYISSSAQGSRIGVSNIFDTTIAGDILWKDTGDMVKNTFTNILLIVFTLFILYGITNLLSAFLAKWVGWSTIQSITELWKSALWGLKIIPTSQGPISLGGAGKAIGRMSKRFDTWLNTKLIEQQTALGNRFNDALGIERELYPKDFAELTRLATEFWKKDSPVNWTNYNNLKTQINGVMTKWKYPWRAIAISTMKGVPTSLEAFLRNIANNKIPLNKFWNFWNNILEQKEGETIQQFIEANYAKNKNFFNMIYEDLWWDSSKLNTNGSWFWDQNMKWKKSE